MSPANDSEDRLESMTAHVTGQSAELVKRLTAVAQPEAVFSKPIQVGDYTVVTASEVVVALGTGFGVGGGDFEGAEAEARMDGPASGMGGGGGGAGYTGTRPVAVVSVGPQGVAVEPILDRTKLGLALITAIGGMFLMLGRMAGRRR